jgi:hypothetical protein
MQHREEDDDFELAEGALMWGGHTCLHCCRI